MKMLQVARACQMGMLEVGSLGVWLGDRQASGSSDVSSGRLGGMLDDTNGLPNKCGRQVSTTCIRKTIGSMPDADPDNIQNLLEFAM
ncbi:unnamed protein product [Ilex paraguariensis]|uniref:Uncharacterized protein n=1 Tax=Ilex paraguariensis TaxID=185542 RepID=A0ABC8UK81_9AQUA